MTHAIDQRFAPRMGGRPWIRIQGGGRVNLAMTQTTADLPRASRPLAIVLSACTAAATPTTGPRRPPATAASASAALRRPAPRRHQGALRNGQHRRQPVGRLRGQRGRRRLPAQERARLHRRQEEHHRAGLVAGLPDRRSRRDPRELGPRGPRRQVHHHRQDGPGRRSAPATTGSSAGTSRSSSSTPTRTSSTPRPTRRSSTSTPTSSRRRSPEARASSSTVTRRSSRTISASIDGFGLNYKVVYSGSETASNKAIQSAIDQKKPILAYYYTPNWFSAKVDLVHIELPAWTAGCDDAKLKTIKCDYPPYHLNKVVSTKFATSGSPALHAHLEVQVDQRGPEPGRGLHHRPEACRTTRPPRSGWTPTPTSGRPGCRRRAMPRLALTQRTARSHRGRAVAHHGPAGARPRRCPSLPRRRCPEEPVMSGVSPVPSTSSSATARAPSPACRSIRGPPRSSTRSATRRSSGSTTSGSSSSSSTRRARSRRASRST